MTETLSHISNLDDIEEQTLNETLMQEREAFITANEAWCRTVVLNGLMAKINYDTPASNTTEFTD